MKHDKFIETASNLKNYLAFYVQCILQLMKALRNNFLRIIIMINAHQIYDHC